MEQTTVSLAPLDGITDAPLRQLLCAHGGYAWCYAPFIRVTDLPVTVKNLYRAVPELRTDGRTADGTPVGVQLLGDDPEIMAVSAARAAALGARGVNLNFGCPSRFVHHAGAMLLREPELLRRITAAVRDAVGGVARLSIKLRTGFESPAELPAVIAAVAVPGVAEIIVHARTRRALYAAAAIDWQAVRPYPERFPEITFTVNGDIDTAAAAAQCRAASGCRSLMCGRGALQIPNLGRVISAGAPPYDDARVLAVVDEEIELLQRAGYPERVVLARSKQFLGYARKSRPRLRDFFAGYCRSPTVTAARRALAGFIAGGAPGPGGDSGARSST